MTDKKKKVVKKAGAFSAHKKAVPVKHLHGHATPKAVAPEPKKAKRRPMPKCIGSYEHGDTTCNGDPRGETEIDRASCVFRDRCAGFKKSCAEKGLTPDQFVQVKKITDADDTMRTYAFAKGDDDEFASLLVRNVKRWGVKDGRVTVKKPDDSKPERIGGRPKKKYRDVADRTPSPEGAKAVREASVQRVADGTDRVFNMGAWFSKKLHEATGRYVSPMAGGTNVGSFFIVDRLDTSKYLSVYCRAESGKKVAVAAAYPATRENVCQIRIAADPKDFLGINPEVAKLRIVPIKDGSFKSRTGKLDKAGVAFAAEVIASLIEQGKIELPVEQRAE